MTPITMKEVAAFLLGEASLDGYWFGERHPISPFWWREHLRAAQPATAPEPSTEVAVGKLCKSLREDLDYAWTWHCNIAMTAFDAGCPNDVANEGAARFMQLLAGVDTRNHPGFQVTQDFYLPSTAPATAPESGVMTEIDYNDDDALRFVQRVLESDAPLSDIRDARNMVVEIRTRVLKARASKPATAPEPICTKCGDVITAHDPGLCGCCLSTRDATSPEQKDRPINCGTGHCSCIECVMLFNTKVSGCCRQSA